MNSINKGIKQFEFVMWIIIGVAILGSFFGLSQNVISKIIEWLISIGIGILLSGISGGIVEAFSRDLLKRILIIIPIGPFDFSLTLFAIITFIVKIWLFGI